MVNSIRRMRKTLRAQLENKNNKNKKNAFT